MRHLRHDECRKDAVRTPRGHAMGHITVEIVEPCTDGEKECELNQNNSAAAEQGNARFAQVLCRQQPLHHELIGAMTGHGQETTADKPRPEGIGLAQAESKMEDGDLAGSRSHP